METPIPAKADNLEVTGVSRSGRVRKKSSKLVDFQSPDDIDASRAKRPAPAKGTNSKSIASTPPSSTDPPNSNVPQIQSPPRIKMEQGIEMVSPSAVNVSIEDAAAGEEALNAMDVQSDDDGPNPLQIDTTVRRSAYMTEKSTKKKIFKDGKLITKKPQRKDKGKSRFTAYMLWAKDVRQEMLYTYPELDFSTISRRLGEMWANVPSNEKYNWRRRAKRLAAKGKDKPKQKPLATSKTITSKFLNRNTHSARAKKGAAQSEKIITAKETQSLQTPHASPVTNKTSPGTASHPTKASGTAPVDVAAHLKLLGDSLILIGQRLKEHEGQIAVSGSLSVLLDSLLCSIAPLMCLTTFIPEMGDEAIADIKTTMLNALDNIAYVMPGL